jgi:hypothetical protein
MDGAGSQKNGGVKAGEKMVLIPRYVFRLEVN